MTDPDPADRSVPDVAAARDHVLDEVVRFARSLRHAGVEVPANAATEATRALATVGFDRARARAALRATLVTQARDIERFEELFPTFWRRLTEGLDPERESTPAPDTAEPESGLPPMAASATPDATAGGDPADVGEGGTERVRTEVTAADPGEEPDEEAPESTAAYSPAGRSTAVQADETILVPAGGVEDAVGDLTGALARLQGRRWGRSGDERIATRRALRESLATGGALLDVPRTERARTDVTATFLVDVSQSVLDTVDRGFLLEFLRTVSGQWRSVRIFFFDTSAREVTDQFDAESVEAAASALERAEAEWGGGTRIGNAITTVRDRHPDAVDRETVVFVVSDGLEVGEIDDLETGMAWLSRLSPAVLWLNPLAAGAEYEPVCRGMAAALPYVDGLFAFAGPDDVTELARQLSLYGTGRAIGYEQDPRRA
ncbi:MAG: VWA domain-containing protein [Haloarculaceae archaeon]